MTNPKQLRIAELCMRWALGATFLSAVADRFGLWGPPGSRYASWGDWSHFLKYSAQLNWFLPASLQNPVAWGSTLAETVFGLALIAGFYTRIAAYGSAILLTLFALAMTFALGIKAPLNYSVFPDAAGALLLALCCRPHSKQSRTDK
ncbi:MAG: DoxX family membrane protein [Acidobacteriaceae bacterium]|nr:DoxX family membrane protein [Acidobacteriaceae bacterium]